MLSLVTVRDRVVDLEAGEEAGADEHLLGRVLARQSGDALAEVGVLPDVVEPDAVHLLHHRGPPRADRLGEDEVDPRVALEHTAEHQVAER